jgi:hypothetical protein
MLHNREFPHQLNNYQTFKDKLTLWNFNDFLQYNDNQYAQIPVIINISYLHSKAQQQRINKKK